MGLGDDARHVRKGGKVNDSASKGRVDFVQFVNDNYLAICVALAIIALSFVGISAVAPAALIGALLCVIILTKRSMILDLWVFVPLVAYVAIGGFATYAAFGTIAEGYVGVQAVCLAIYLAIASADERESSVMRRLCVGWAVLASCVGIALFVIGEFMGPVLRLDWPFGNADPLGIFLVVAWFVIPGLSGGDALSRCLRRGEPALLVALALTLTMTSFAALAVGTIAMLLYSKRGRSWKELSLYAISTVARLVIGVGAGIVLYGVSLAMPASWVVIAVFALVVAIVAFWPKIIGTLERHAWLGVLLVLLGIVLVIGMFLIRANALARLSERIAMIQSGVDHVIANPLFGMGPFGWFDYNYGLGLFPSARLIHSTLMSTAVELGVFAAIALVVVAVRFFIKRRDPEQRGGFIAFIVQNMFDLGFFFPAVTGLLMVTVATPRKVGVCLHGVAPRLLAAVLLACFVGLAVGGVWAH